MTVDSQDVATHFAMRAGTYDRSSSWCTDEALGSLLLSVTRPVPDARVLDVACGTGLVSRLFTSRVARVVGVDITREMAEQAVPYLDELVIAPAESMPFDSSSFDLVVCRQGIQFMTLPEAIKEMVRVVRPGGLVALINLCAYGEADRAEYFEVLRLRNPARRNYFLPEELADLLRSAGCDQITLDRHVSIEDVDVWSDNGAIGEERREAIRRVYRDSTPEFRRLHAVTEDDGRIRDHMLFVVAVGRKPTAAATGEESLR